MKDKEKQICVSTKKEVERRNKRDKEKDELSQALLHYATAEASGGIKTLIDCEGCAFYLYEMLGYRKIPGNSVVLSRKEYEMLANKYKNLEIKYSNLCDNYRLCKDANETLKQNVITTCKKTVKEILQEIRAYYPIDKEHCNDGELFILNLCEDIALRYGVEVEE